MKYSLITFLALFAGFMSMANQPRRSFILIQYSENKAFYFKSIPYTIHPGWLGKTLVCNTKTDSVRYTIENYMNEYAHLSNDGKTLVQIASRIFKDNSVSVYKQAALRVYYEGKLQDSLSLDVLAPHTKVDFNGDIGTWLKYPFTKEDTLYIPTYSDSTILFSFKDHKIAGRQSNDLILKLFKAKALFPETKAEFFQFPCPVYYCMPNVLNGTNLDSAFLRFMKAEFRRSGYDMSLYNLGYRVMAERNGRCTLYELEITDRKQYKPHPALSIFKLPAADWIKKQKVTPDLIPLPCEKWLFASYLQL